MSRNAWAATDGVITPGVGSLLHGRLFNEELATPGVITPGVGRVYRTPPGRHKHADLGQPLLSARHGSRSDEGPYPRGYAGSTMALGPTTPPGPTTPSGSAGTKWTFTHDSLGGTPGPSGQSQKSRRSQKQEPAVHAPQPATPE